MIDIETVTTCDDTQIRMEIDQETVERYTAAIDQGETLPPITVFHDGTTHWLADGFHRLKAYRAAGKQKIPAEVKEGTKEDAVWHAVTANKTHGLPMSSDDKRRAIEVVLAHPKGAEMSNRSVAKHVGCSDHTVAAVRKELKATAQSAQLNERKGADGRTRKTKTKQKPGKIPEEANAVEIVKQMVETIKGFLDTAPSQNAFDKIEAAIKPLLDVKHKPLKSKAAA